MGRARDIAITVNATHPIARSKIFPARMPRRNRSLSRAARIAWRRARQGPSHGSPQRAGGIRLGGAQRWAKRTNQSEEHREGDP
jgi:hypothetical protein